MYGVSTQGADERLINVHYYYLFIYSFHSRENVLPGMSYKEAKKQYLFVSKDS